jgi:hypothetical protein
MDVSACKTHGLVTNMIQKAIKATGDSDSIGDIQHENMSSSKRAGCLIGIIATTGDDS